MAPPQDEWELPRLKASIGFEDDFQYLLTQDADTEFFDVKFLPYLDPAEDPVFAAVSKKHIVIYRLSSTANPAYELIRLIRDDDKDAVNCSCTWAADPETDLPYLCVAGLDSKVKVYDVFNGTSVRTLVGHGSEINDLATSPISPLLIASASDDTTVRIWSLAAKDAKQPCVCILAGEGHSSGLLTVAFHSCGRFVLTAGHDNCVCLWTLPDLSERRTDKNPAPPIIVHYPHFFTSEVHSGIVDCVAFFGDLILSRACHEDIIVLWRIEGFSSRDPIPLASDAPTTSEAERPTRSFFAPATGGAIPPPYTRLIHFFTPESGHQFYLRFRLFHDQEKHPILAFGNAHSDIFFWDLARLTEYHTFRTKLAESKGTLPASERPSFLQVQKAAVTRIKDAEYTDAATGRIDALPPAEKSDLEKQYSAETIRAWESMYDMTRSKPQEAVVAHHKQHITVKDFIGRQVAWSPSGEWCIVAGSKNLAIILQRWQKKEDEKKK